MMVLKENPPLPLALPPNAGIIYLRVFERIENGSVPAVSQYENCDSQKKTAKYLLIVNSIKASEPFASSQILAPSLCETSPSTTTQRSSVSSNQKLDQRRHLGR